MDYNKMLKKMKNDAAQFVLDADKETMNEASIDGDFIYAKVQKKLIIPINETKKAIEMTNDLNTVLFRGVAYIDEDWENIVFVVPVRGTDAKALKKAILICEATVSGDPFMEICREFGSGE